MSVRITKLQLVDEPPRKTRAECSIEANGFRINGMRLVERANGELIVSFPFWKDCDGGTHEYLYPLTKDLHDEISKALLQAYYAATGKSGINNVFGGTGSSTSLRDINLHLKYNKKSEPEPEPEQEQGEQLKPTPRRRFYKRRVHG